MFRNRILKKIICILTFLVIISTFVSGSYSLSLKTPNPSVKEAINKTGILIHNNTPDPTVGTFSGEWSILCLARGGIKVPQSYYDKYYSNVVKTLKECDGILHNMKYTEYSRVILGLTSIGKDPRNVGGYNLLEKLADFKKVIKQGINGPIFALIALDTNNYEIPQVKGIEAQTTRDMLIDYILSKEITQKSGTVGGWALRGNVPDPDITAMALQSLAPYKNDEKVRPYIERALNVLSELQNKKGGYESWGTTNSESVDQVIVALCALGIDPAKDERFIKEDGSWLISNLLTFYVKGGGFKHVLDMDIDAMATDQGMYALVAYQRFVDGKNRLYDMTDVNKTLDTGDNPDLDKDDNKDDYDKDSNNENNSSTLINNGGNSLGTYSSSANNSINKSNNISSSNNKSKDKEATIVVKSIYEGEKDGLIAENKKCIIVEFPKKNDKVSVVFNKKYKLYYSEELSKLSKSPTYISLIDKSIEKDVLLEMKNYEFKENEIDEILFGDINDDKVVNAQDILNIQSILNGKLSRPNDKKILAANVSVDSKIDNGDIDSIISKFTSNKKYKIFTIYDDKEDNNDDDKGGEGA